MIKRRSIKVVDKKPKSNLSGNLAMDKAKRGGRNANVPVRTTHKLTRMVKTIPFKKKKGY